MNNKKEKSTSFQKRKILGFVCLIIVGIYIAVVSWELFKLQDENKTLKEKKDCTVHQAVIDNLVSENKDLQELLQATKSNNQDTILSTIDFFIKSYYTNDNNGIDYPYKNIKSLVSDELYLKLRPNFDTTDTENIYYQSGINSIDSFYKNIDEKTVETISYVNMFIRNSQAGNRVNSNVIFRTKLTYDSENDKWIVADIISSSAIRILE